MIRIFLPINPKKRQELKRQVVDIVRGRTIPTHIGILSVEGAILANGGSTAQELHIREIDIHGEAHLPVSPLVAAAAKPALHIHLASLGKVLVAKLRQSPPRAHIKPFGFLSLLSGAGGIAAAGGDAEGGNTLTVGSVAHLWVSTQMTDDNDLVQLTLP